MLAQFSIHPVGEQESLSRYVAEVIRYVREECDKKELKYEFHSMGTEIEGPDEDVWSIMKGAHDLMKLQANRVYTLITIDDRKGRSNAMVDKKAKIEYILGEKLD